MTTQEQVKDVVSQVLADKADKGGIKRVVWIGAGGSNGGNYPAQYFMEHEATQVVSSATPATSSCTPCPPMSTRTP